MRPSALRWVLTAFVLATAGCGRGPFWTFLDDTRCTSVDFVFVIDNSQSMERHQANLRASFGPFIEGIQSTLDDVDDYHVGVVTTDPYRYNGGTDCRRLGALVTQTGGEDVSPTQCGPFAEGHNYMTAADDLEETFNCAASVGVSGDPIEKPMEALQNTVRGDRWWNDDCNEDFIRNDALLVAVTVTDEWDGPDDIQEGSDFDGVLQYSRGTPEDWYDGIVEAKGRPENAVVVSLLSSPASTCTQDSPLYDGRHIADFTDRFPYGFVGDICERDYGELFETAVEEIDAACSGEARVVP